MRYYIIAGEASGDLHGSNLIRCLKEVDREAVFRCWGGDLMAAAGAEVVMHYRSLAFMGFSEVIKNLGKIRRNFRFCKEDIREFNPDVVVLIDYPGFNLRMAKFIHNLGIKVFYYISPQVWAWNRSRVYKIKSCVDKMFAILPCEKDFYRKYNYDIDFVGHPLLDAIAGRSGGNPAGFRLEHKLGEKAVIALLPGSRKQEISRMLPVMLSVLPSFPAFTFVVAAAPSIEASFYRNLVRSENVKIVYDHTYDLLEISHAALVTSGTATLETALFRVPEVVCYSGNHLSYLLARMLVKVKYISLVNLIMDRQVVLELIQNNLKRSNLEKELTQLLASGPYRDKMLKDMEELAEKLGGPGASERTAGLMVKYLKG